MDDAGIPVPIPTASSAPYWEGARRGEFLLPGCLTCGKLWFPPSECCPNCSSFESEWRRASGKGEIVTFSVVHRAPGPAFAGRVPYVVAIVQLAEGPFFFCNIVDCPPESVQIGMPVEVTFEQVGEEAAIPQFRPQRRGGGREG